MPLVSYRASAEPVLRWKRSDRVVSRLHRIREVAALGALRPSTLRGGHRQSAKQVLKRRMAEEDLPDEANSCGLATNPHVRWAVFPVSQ